MRGVAYVVYGPKAGKELTGSIRTLRDHHDWPVAVVGDMAQTDVENIPFVADYSTQNGIKASRWAKLNLNNLLPALWTDILYIDADTRVRGDLSAGFDILAGGWDIVMAPSVYQGAEVMQHVGREERGATIGELSDGVLALQAGLIFFHRQRCESFFEAWREEWQRWQGQDQGAFLRAYHRVKPRLWLLGLPWNSRGGAIVEHRFGKAR